ncbi:MAG: polysaccharide deacetylase family protein [Candidatus Omnitrophica bacterium]|nr:polysaccharide deacetylase family protein [Candidatus Omnitrophota bacterium]
MRFFKRILYCVLFFFCIGSIGFCFWMRDRYVVPILMYHHVGVPSVCKWHLNVVSENSFDYQMSFLKRHGFKVISFKDLVEGLKAGRAFARNTVVIQFDDGYEDNYKYAFPILKKYGFPATVFVISDMVGQPGFLTWDEIKEMEQENFVIGSHTQHHVYLPKANLNALQEEIKGSKKVLEDRLGHPIDYFCYPVGGFTAQIKGLVKQAGYKAAVTTNRGKDRFNQDLYELKRIRMNNTDSQYSGLILWFKYSGYYNLFRQFKREKRTRKECVL